jgi:lysyl-tRNA synthetase class 2
MVAPSEAWRPTAPLGNLRRRAEILAGIRAFFARRGVLEVETPALSAATVTDLHLASLETRSSFRGPSGPPGPSGPATLYLQTSPEFAMKRLLAAGSGPIYQIGKAFRDGESGRRHNPEFTLLEWYRPGFDHLALMDEVEALLAEVLGTPRAERWTYGALFRDRLGVDPHEATAADLAAAARRAGLDPGGGPGSAALDREDLLHLLMGLALEPTLGRGRPSFVHDFPASQAALARVRPGPPPVAERFEVFIEGVELANGFHELSDPVEQRRRFEADLARRRERGLPEPPIDERLLAALAAGLPACAGVALGVDRLVMLAVGAASLDEVLAFPIDRA